MRPKTKHRQFQGTCTQITFPGTLLQLCLVRYFRNSLDHWLWKFLCVLIFCDLNHFIVNIKMVLNWHVFGWFGSLGYCNIYFHQILKSIILTKRGQQKPTSYSSSIFVSRRLGWHNSKGILHIFRVQDPLVSSFFL